MLSVSIFITLSEVAFITMLQHAYMIIEFVPVYLLFLVFLLQYGFFIAAVRLRQGFIRFATEISKSGKMRFRQGLDLTKGRFLRGLRAYVTVLMIIIIPTVTYYLTLITIEDVLTRALVSTFLLGLIFYISNTYHYTQVSVALESKVVNDLKISSTVTRIYFSKTLKYGFLLAYWVLIPLHIWMVLKCGRVHFCGCMDIVQILAASITLLRPLWILLQVQVYMHVKQMHFPVPEMDPELRDRNLI
jgi:hypothetical protein